MLSRDADACYWIGRYVERAEATARMVDVHYHAALETPLTVESARKQAYGADTEGDSVSDHAYANAGSEMLEYGNASSAPDANLSDPCAPHEDPDISTLRWQSILAISGSGGTYRKRYETENDRDVLHFFAFDLNHSNSIISTWKAARDNARSIREQLASEMWESVNVSYLRLLDWNVDRVLAGSPHEFFQIVKDSSHLFQGILNRTMLMGETRDWLDTGRFLERAGQTARLLDVKFHDLLPAFRSSDPSITAGASALQDAYGVGGALDMHGWIAVLKSVSAFEMYLKTHQDGISPANVVDFLVLNTQFPASVRHGIGRVESCLQRISGSNVGAQVMEPEVLAAQLRARLTASRSEDIILGGLHTYLDSVQHDSALLGNAITRTYLSY